MTESKDFISIKDLFLQIKDIISFLISKWVVILIACVIGATLGFLYSKNLKPFYTGKLTFVLATESKGNGLSGLATQFGVDLGGASNDAFSSQNILGLMNSERIMRKVFFRLIPDTKDNFANLLARESGLADVWESDSFFKKLFPFPQDLMSVTPIQDSMLREMYGIINNQYLKITKPEKNDFFYSVVTKSENELIATYLPIFIVDETADLYIKTKTGQARRNLEMLQLEADSLNMILSGSISSASSTLDKTFNLNPAFQARRNPVQRETLKTNVLTTAYAEVLKNLEIAKINLQRDTPLYQVIDSPQMPLKLQIISKKKYVILGFIIAGILSCLWFIAVKGFKNIFN
jgi:hypothetical protein